MRLEVPGSLHEADHLSGRVNRQTMRGEPRPWRDVGGHLTNQVKLSVGCGGEQRDHQVFQCNHSNLKLHQFSIRQEWNIGLRRARNGSDDEGAGPRAAFVLPSRKRHSAQGSAFRGFKLFVRHG